MANKALLLFTIKYRSNNCTTVMVNGVRYVCQAVSVWGRWKSGQPCGVSAW